MDGHEHITPPGPIQIDLRAVLKSRLGARSRWVPSLLVRRLERLIRQEQMNAMLAEAYPRRGSEFCRAVLSHLQITVNVEGLENMPPPEHSKVIIASNHPLGGLDGMALIAFAASYYGREPLFIINDLLMAVEPLREVFVPVNKHGAQSRLTVRAIDEAMESDRPVLIFPAGLCSRKIKGKIQDLGWQKMFVQKARQWHRDIIPVSFIARNSDSFYKWANRRKRLGIKFNAEMVLLPGEVFKNSGKTFTIRVSQPVSADTLSADYNLETARVRQMVDAGISSP